MKLWHVSLRLAAAAFAWDGAAATRWQRGDEEGFWEGRSLVAARVETVLMDPETWVMEAELQVLGVARTGQYVPCRLTLANRLVRSNPAAVFQPEPGEKYLLCIEASEAGDGTWRIPPVATPLLGEVIAARKLPGDHAGKLSVWLENIQSMNKKKDGAGENPEPEP